jgi:streptogramin lyase
MKQMWGLIVLCATVTVGAGAQQGGAAGGGVAPAELEQWIRATGGGSTAAADPNSGTRFLASLTAAERQGGFLFRQRCYACHYSALSPASYGPRLSQKNVEGREEIVRTTIADGTPRMPAFRHGLTAAQIDSIVGYLKKVKDGPAPSFAAAAPRNVPQPVGDVQTGDRTLTGMVRSASGERMEGVTVSARAAGSTLTTSVFTDSDGEYVFPPMADGFYKVWAQAVGYEAGRTELSLTNPIARWDVSLTAKKDFELQLPADRWLAALPEDTIENRRMKEVFRLACNGCHTHSFTLATRFDRKGWDNILTVMSRIGAYGYGDPANAAKAKPSPIIEKYKEPLAAWLTTMRGPGPSPMKFAPRPRPRGDATLMVVREYDMPEPGYGYPLFHDGSNWSDGPVDFMDHAHHHTMEGTLDFDGHLWVSDFFHSAERTIAKIDWRTGVVTNIPVREALRRNNGLPGGHDIETSEDGMIWWDLTGTGRLARVDPKTAKVDVFTPSGKRQVGYWIAADAQGGIWSQAVGGALHFDPKTGKWTEFGDPASVAGKETYGMAADADGNGWTSMFPIDVLIKSDIKTGTSEVVDLPKRESNALRLFNDEERKFFDELEQEFRARGKLDGQAIRKPGGDFRRNVIWGPAWHGGSLLKIDARTKRVTTYPYPLHHANGYQACVDHEGMVWVVFSNEDAIGKFNPDTEQWTIYELPTRGFRSHGLKPVTINGRTQIGMAYLGAGKAAKLEFRTRAEHQALKAAAK